MRICPVIVGRQQRGTGGGGSSKDAGSFLRARTKPLQRHQAEAAARLKLLVSDEREKKNFLVEQLLNRSTISR